MRTAALALLLACAMIAVAQQPPARNSAARQLHALLDQDWEWRMRTFPTWASHLGDKRYNDQWGDASPAGARRANEHRQRTLKSLLAIPRAQLTPADQLNYDLFRQELESSIGEFDIKWYTVPLNQRGGIQTADELADALSFTTVKDYEDWIARLNALPVAVAQTTESMREGIREKIVLPKIIVQRIPPQVEKQIVSQPAQSPFYKPFQQMAAAIPAAEQQRLRTAAEQAIAQKVVPAYREFRQFLEKEYLPAAFDQVGIWQAPTGAKIYEFFVRDYTTTDVTAQQVHEIGLREVARIRTEMEKVKEQAKFKGTLPEFFQHLRTDPKYFYPNGEELLEAYRAMSKRIDPQLVKVFRTLPRTPYGVEPIPMTFAPDTTTAYYSQPAADGSRAGRYFVNLYKPESRPKWEMMALSLHEAVPGHHLQIALAQELGEVPNFRRYGGYTAFVEGWALYAESLGEEMGLYETPEEKFGQLTYEMWRAVRLVVDTGIHAMKWDRKKAIDFFMQNAPKAELDIVNEVDRYIAWPGQALAYKIGELKIKELRARATRELGPKFDLKKFHDVVLLSGAVPLNVLERNVEAWIAREKRAPAAPMAKARP